LKGGAFSSATGVACQFKSPALEERQGRATRRRGAPRAQNFKSKAGPPAQHDDPVTWRAPMPKEQYFPFKLIKGTKPLRVTYAQIITAMRNLSRANQNGKGRSYFVTNPLTNESFSPKAVLREIARASGVDLHFQGGKAGANRVFHAFGLPVVKGPLDKKSIQRLSPRIANAKTLLTNLFSRKWSPLPRLNQMGHIERLPGVYLIAYSNEALKGKQIRESEVFYVGMTCEGGLQTRLKQFRKGVHEGGHHSGANRFFQIWLDRQPYKENAEAKLYYAYVPIDCRSAKEDRSVHDLINLSKVPQLELAAIARVKKAIGHEPLLNKK
jgi:hypothetical protein